MTERPRGPWCGEAPSLGTHPALGAEPPLRLGSPLAMRDAALAGAGAAILPILLVGGDIEAGRLLHLLPGWTSPPKPIQFVYPSAQSMTGRLRALIDWLAREIRGADKLR